MTLKDLIAGTTVRTWFNQDHYADAITYTVVDQVVGGAGDVNHAGIPVILDPAIDEQRQGAIEAAMEFTIPDGQLWASPITASTISGGFTQGETLDSDQSAAQGYFVALGLARETIIHVPADPAQTFGSTAILTGQTSGATATSTAIAARIGVDSPKPGDYFTTRGYRWTVEDVIDAPDQYSSILVARRGAAA